ncbi:DUF1524 domain-containing protein [Microbulbifer sp. CnH-101-G]|uniref:GmrSD restriction endonuclease domain-containing protein n=1 Tax=Microbulbifer sp. CnH-101-G TaxID=3243393 RepID=UPI00403A2A0C
MGPYTGQFFQKASDLNVEHIVPLSWAHKHGGANWTREQRRAFAEDPANLWLMDDGHNQSNGDIGPYQWLPPLLARAHLFCSSFRLSLKSMT